MACKTAHDKIISEETGRTVAENYAIGESYVGNKPIQRHKSVAYESFSGAGWNAENTTINIYTPGLNNQLPEFFFFTQFQGPHSFKVESEIVRLGKHSAKLHWKHQHPEQWNGDPNKLDNTDRKAMFHGKRASTNSTTLWYGFSAYFPSVDFTLTGDQRALFFQLHGAKDKNGEPSRIPPISLTIGTDGFRVGYSWDSKELSTSIKGEGVNHLNLPVSLPEYQDRWVDFVLQVRTNPFEEKGYIRLWIDGKRRVNHHNIQLGYNDKNGLYPSYGWYLFGTNSTRDSDAIMYIDELRQIEGENINYYDVAPGYFHH
ncbi:polysaccharide lyase [Psychrosphaera sp. B3R10]|uniref:heparin lyase I family protein n=1 Tax=unclassified Psychrosphaera TaxID=2641570 RepID=UPI001C081485|nr:MULTISPECIES: heparin lyase I family protein [unclassified Psychrosphaera]MBU2883522.1 polysaccharide lyase [Psychrosphaera sp. I2R16]MBU2989701.1 polysaccharide lyase [Psychrosphaera sp. B3R10]MDO6719845.1 heparin lyase I family protein [Psychrosphaera sp. 1_MG-2023]